jgi:hypothetical protein
MSMHVDKELCGNEKRGIAGKGELISAAKLRAFFLKALN